MKQISIILNGVLGVAIIILYVLHFTDPVQEAEALKNTTFNPDSTALSIAFVELDSILANYEMYINLQDNLLKKQQQSEAELNSKLKAWEKAAADYQDKASKGLITRTNAMQVENQLAQEQQGLIQLRDQMGQQLAEEKQVADRQVMYSILEYLEEFNKTRNYQFIFSRAFGSNVLLAEPGLEITGEVLAGLNDAYSKAEENK